MKKSCLLMVTCVLVSLLFSACGGNENSKTAKNSGGDIQTFDINSIDTSKFDASKFNGEIVMAEMHSTEKEEDVLV